MKIRLALLYLHSAPLKKIVRATMVFTLLFYSFNFYSSKNLLRVRILQCAPAASRRNAIKRNEKWTLTHIRTRAYNRAHRARGETESLAGHFFTINYIPRQGEVFLRRYIPDSRKRCTFPASRCRFYKTERNKIDSPSECEIGNNAEEFRVIIVKIGSS